MVLRLIIAIVLLASGAAGFALMQRIRLVRLSKKTGQDPILSNTLPGIPTLLYFTTPACVSCKYAQEPVMEKLKNEMGDTVNIVKVNATEDYDAARRWKVHTIPTIYVLDGSGKPVDINQGTADIGLLKTQIRAAS
jgi:thioredoxin 1